MNYLQLPAGEKAPDIFNIVVEIPHGSANKYEFDPRLNIFRLDRPLYSPMHYPGDYGFVPSTIAADGDPLDVLVLVDRPSFTGCIIEARAIGMLAMVDQGKEDLKILCVPIRDPRAETLQTYQDVHPHRLREIEHFFSIYKELEGKSTETNGWSGVEQARKAIVTAIDKYKERDNESQI